MNPMVRVAAAVAFLLALTGCNIVVSKDPWFTAADAEPAPVLRDGLWLRAAADCTFDEVKPAERWPDCADASFVRGDERWSMRWDDTDARGRRRRTFAGWGSDDTSLPGGMFVANGDHLIVQLETEGEADTSSPGEVDDEEQQESRGYMYGAIRPTRHDERNKVTAVEAWAIQCGPLPERKRSETAPRRMRDEADGTLTSVTDRPFPGLTVVDSNCIAENVEALRRAALLSENLGEKDKSHWVRDGWR